MTASVKQPIRILVFSSAVLVALLFAEQEAHADDATQADAPAPDSGGAAPPPVVVPPALPPVSSTRPRRPRTRHPDATGRRPADRPAVARSTCPTGSRVPRRRHCRHPSTNPDPGFPEMPVGSGETTNQSADVTTGGTAVANTGGNHAGARRHGRGGSETAQPGVDRRRRSPVRPARSRPATPVARLGRRERDPAGRQRDSHRERQGHGRPGRDHRERRDRPRRLGRQLRGRSRRRHSDRVRRHGDRAERDRRRRWLRPDARADQHRQRQRDRQHRHDHGEADHPADRWRCRQPARLRAEHRRRRRELGFELRARLGEHATTAAGRRA